jgi:hypothetical protein
MTQPTPTNSAKAPPETTLDWFKTHAFTEHSKMLYTPSVQIALRQHLRLSYWLSKCQPITPEGVSRARKAIAFADAPEGVAPVLMDQSHVDAVLCQDQGFSAVTDPDTGEVVGWSIPEMLGMLEHANQCYQSGAQGRAERAKKAADARWSPKPQAAAPRHPPGPQKSTSGAASPAPHAAAEQQPDAPQVTGVVGGTALAALEFDAADF